MARASRIIATTYPQAWAEQVDTDAVNIPKVGDVWLDQDVKNARWVMGEDGRTHAVRRTVRILALEDHRVRVQNTQSGLRRWVRRDAFDAPKSADYGYVLLTPAIQPETIDGAVARA